MTRYFAYPDQSDIMGSWSFSIDWGGLDVLMFRLGMFLFGTFLLGYLIQIWRQHRAEEKRVLKLLEQGVRDILDIK